MFLSINILQVDNKYCVEVADKNRYNRMSKIRDNLVLRKLCGTDSKW